MALLTTFLKRGDENKKLSREAKNSFRSYCEYKVHQYYQRFTDCSGVEMQIEEILERVVAFCTDCNYRKENKCTAKEGTFACPLKPIFKKYKFFKASGQERVSWRDSLPNGQTGGAKMRGSDLASPVWP
jgi:hypothetical protein